jgi:hypothetical protein
MNKSNDLVLNLFHLNVNQLDTNIEIHYEDDQVLHEEYLLMKMDKIFQGKIYNPKLRLLIEMEEYLLDLENQR